MLKPKRRLSYANITATLALVFSMSGGALAANHFLINSTKQINPKILNKLKGKTGATGPAGAAGAQGKEGSAGKEGKAGKEGAVGPAGTAVAYAHVESGGGVDSTNSKNVTSANVSHPGTGVYCFHGLSFTPHAASVAPDGFGPVNGILVNPTLLGGLSACEEAGNQLRVETTLATAPSTLANEPFYILFE
jgi:Collagen triple helix repeat (20 copies)